MFGLCLTRATAPSAGGTERRVEGGWGLSKVAGWGSGIGGSLAWLVNLSLPHSLLPSLYIYPILPRRLRQGQYRHEVKYHFRGSRLAYRFEWACEAADPQLRSRLTIERGFFELHHMEDLEVVQPAEVNGRGVAQMHQELRLAFQTGGHEFTRRGRGGVIRARGANRRH